MYRFFNYKIKRNDSDFILSCDTILQYGNEQEETNNGGFCGAVTPSCWDTALLNKADINNLFVYHLYGIRFCHGCYNKLSDFKGIHQLTNRPAGVYEDSYMVPDGKVYAGLSCDFGVEGFLANRSPVLIVGAELNVGQCKKIFSILKESHYDFSAPHKISLLDSLGDCCRQSMILSYSYDKESVLTVIPGKYGLSFTEEDCSQWELSADVQPVMRKK